MLISLDAYPTLGHSVEVMKNTASRLPAHLRVLTGEQRLGIAIALRAELFGCRRDSYGCVEAPTETARKEFEQRERELSEELTRVRHVRDDGSVVFVGFWQVDGEAVAVTPTRMRRFGRTDAALEAAARWYRSAS